MGFRQLGGSIAVVAGLAVAGFVWMGATGAAWRTSDVAAAEQYRETERERALRYRQRVAAGESAVARSREVATRRATPRRASRTSDGEERASGWTRARERTEHFRDETLPSLRRWLAATAELVDEVVHEELEH